MRKSAERIVGALGGRNIVLFLASDTLLTVSYGGMFVVLFNLYLGRLGYGTGLIGVANGLTFASYSLLSIPAGLLARRWGYRRSMIAGALIYAASLAVICAAGACPPSVRDVLIILGALAMGPSGSLYMVCVAPLLMEAPERVRAAAFSARMAIEVLAAAAGSAIAGFLPGLIASLTGADASGAAPFAGGLIVALVVGALVALPLLPMRDAGARGAVLGDAGASPVPSAETRPPALPWAILAAVSACSLLASAAGSGIGTFITLHLDSTYHLPMSLIGGTISASRFICLLPLALAPALIRKIGPFRAVVLTGAASSVCALLLGTTGTWVVAAVSYTAMGAASSFAGGSADLIYQGSVKPALRPTLTGAVNAFGGLGSAAIMFGGGYLIGIVGYERLFLLSLALRVLQLAVFWLYFRVPRGEHRNAAAHAGTGGSC